MHVLIATDGELDGDRAAAFTGPLAGPDGKVTVLTVVEINRTLLRDLRGLFGERIVSGTEQDAEYVGIRPPASTGPGADFPGDDEVLARYLGDQLEQRTASVITALDAAGVANEALVREGEDAASIVLESIDELDVDVVCVGSHGRGLFDGLLGSVGTKVVRRASVPVLVMR